MTLPAEEPKAEIPMTAKPERDQAPDDQAPDDFIYLASIDRGIAGALRALERMAVARDQARDHQARALGIQARELDRPAGPDTNLVAACIVASALDAHRETITSLAFAKTGALSLRSEREYVESVQEVLSITQSTLSQVNDARNRATSELSIIVEQIALGMDGATTNRVLRQLKDVIANLGRAGAPPMDNPPAEEPSGG